jgi:hypothetical protein
VVAFFICEEKDATCSRSECRRLQVANEFVGSRCHSVWNGSSNSSSSLSVLKREMEAALAFQRSFKGLSETFKQEVMPLERPLNA